MSAGAAKRSWQPVARMVLWQLRTSPAAPAARGFATAGAGGGKGGATWLCRVSAIENGVLRPASWAAAGGGGLPRGGIPFPHARFAGAAPAAAKEEQPEEPKGKGKPEHEPVQSNYWGVTTDKTFTREDGQKWPWNCFRPSETYSPNYAVDLNRHREPTSYIEKLAMWGVRTIKIPVNMFYQKRYGCRAMMLETVAAVPGMVGGMLLHLRSLRRFEQSGGWIKALLDEAENERMHLMTLMDVVQPHWYERWLVVIVQGIFFNAYFLLYVASPRLAHRITGYLEEEAIISYTTFLSEIDNGVVENVPAPPIAIDYWRLPNDARLRDVILALRADEAHHRDVNHYAADIRGEGKELSQSPAPVDYH